MQEAPRAQGFLTHNGVHSFLLLVLIAKSHFSLEEQSSLDLHPTSVHDMTGLPCNPGRQKQIASCLSALHSALLPQIMRSQGLMHSLDTQALVNGQSSSIKHSY